MSDTITAHILAPEAQTNRRTTQHNMHEIAYSECFKAWMGASVLYYRACEWINRIRAVVGLRWRPAAPAQHSITIRQAFLRTQRRQDWDQIEDSLLFYCSSSSCSSSKAWLTDGSCYGVTSTWGSQRHASKGTEGDMGQTRLQTLVTTSKDLLETSAQQVIIMILFMNNTNIFMHEGTLTLTTQRCMWQIWMCVEVASVSWGMMRRKVHRYMQVEKWSRKQRLTWDPPW